MLELAIAAVAGLVVGWVLRGVRRRRRYSSERMRWQATVDALQGKLALERLRIDNYLRQLREETPQEPAPMLDLQREAHLARPHARTSDSTAARA